MPSPNAFSCRDDCIKTRNTSCPGIPAIGLRAIPIEKNCVGLPNDCCIGREHSGCVTDAFCIWCWLFWILAAIACYLLYKRCTKPAEKADGETDPLTATDEEAETDPLNAKKDDK